MKKILVTKDNLACVKCMIAGFLHLSESEDYKSLVMYHNFDCSPEEQITPYGAIRYLNKLVDAEIDQTINFSNNKKKENFIRIKLGGSLGDSGVVLVHIGSTVYITEDRLVINEDWDSTSDFEKFNCVVLKCKKAPPYYYADDTRLERLVKFYETTGIVTEGLDLSKLHNVD